MAVLIGATTYVFRYLLSDLAKAPALGELIQIAHTAGLERLQVCENARPLTLSPSEWANLNSDASQLGLQLALGCMTLDSNIVDQYLDRAEAMGGTYLRIVLERDGPARLNGQQIRSFLDRLAPALERRRVRLAIENHFEIPAALLAESVAAYPPELIGFCLDVANSLRNFEDADQVFDLLGNRAVCYHLKDYRVDGSNVGFTVSGVPFGEGQLDVPHVLRRVFEADQSPEIYLETWTPSTGDAMSDISMDADWLRLSIRNLRAALLRRGMGSGSAGR